MSSGVHDVVGKNADDETTNAREHRQYDAGGFVELDGSHSGFNQPIDNVRSDDQREIGNHSTPLSVNAAAPYLVTQRPP
jgi:hypothetical protein